jgi:hypothetical protein
VFDALFADLAAGFAAQFGGPFYDGTVTWPGTPTYDSGGSIDTPADPVTSECQVQVDVATEDMRTDAGFVATDMRLLVLASSLTGTLDTTARIAVDAGPYAGTVWTLHSATRDPAGIGWECRGRQVR